MSLAVQIALGAVARVACGLPALVLPVAIDAARMTHFVDETRAAQAPAPRTAWGRFPASGSAAPDTFHTPAHEGGNG